MENENKNILAFNLTNLRNKKELTQEAAAEQIGVSNKTISKWECGLSSPDCDLLPKIANVYNTTLNGLFGIEEKKNDVISEISNNLCQKSLATTLQNSSSYMRSIVEGVYSANNQISQMEDLIPPNIISPSRRSFIQREFLYMTYINHDDMNMVLGLFLNKNNFSCLEQQEEAIARLFALLGTVNSQKFVRAIFTQGFPNIISAKYLGKICSVNEECARIFLDELTEISKGKYKLCKKEIAMLKDGEIEIYKISEDSRLLALLCLAHELLFVWGGNNYGCGGSGKMILKEKKS